ncbi:trifunctional MMPL family transporter/lysophospholipid acyltransferase/class I SAM-dependent methyltransferase [Taibaiella sp. KBW10]|uniref:trifunctional MMPL family transporter/lysophospholipid acyltransferase/class I SAM-dependent methyltransferase n=1 Tax=Taibaiella sp. KBW10 TaxID=2153357 RepID=UPI001315510C|nr:trifunctional MMPL family transporter/lysophospholipid acyltransferase/class I SAM-dependent methyltransferase [Taibaiella sp. KBW10]
MQTVFLNIFDYFKTHRKAFWWSFTLLFMLVAAGATRIRFESDINKMIPHDPTIEAMGNILNKTKTGEQLVFTLSFKDSTLQNPDSLIALQQQLEERLKPLQTQYINAIQSINNNDKEQQFSDIALQYLPLFLNEADYQKLDTLSNPERMPANFEQLHKLLLSPAGMVAKNWVASDPIGMMPLAFDKMQSLNFDPNYELYNGYIFNKSLNKLTFFVTPKYASGETGKNKAFMASLDQILNTFQQQYKGAEVQYFGGVAVAAANAAQMQQDSSLTLSITIILILALTYYVFRRKRTPLIIIIPVVFGALFGMSMTALLQGTVSVIAIGAGAIILGIAVDFSVHFMSHARTHPDMRDNVKGLVLPLTLGAITTIGAFFALRFANAPLLQDLGTFAAFSLLGASLFTLIFLPHITPRPKTDHGAVKENLIDKIAHWKPEGNKWLLAFVLLLTPVLWHFAKKVQFDGDLMKLNYMSPKLAKAQEQLNKDNAFALSSVFIVAKGADAEQAALKLEQSSPMIQQLYRQQAIKKVINPTTVLPSLAEQQKRIVRWQAYWTEEKIEATLLSVRKAAAAAGFSPDAFAAFETTLRQKYSPFDTATTAFLQQILPSSFAQDAQKSYAIATLKVAPEHRAQVLKAFAQQKDLIATDRQSVSESLLSLLQNDFNKILYISGGLVFLALLIAYGRFELALISFLPMMISWIWIMGIMTLFGLKFNIVNIIIATLLFGLGDDYSIFMMDSLMEKYRTGKNHIKSARSAVYLSVLTTITGLGTLIFAKHPALQSIALISVVGLVCVVFISQVLQPFLFNFLIQKRASKGFMPFTLWSLTKSVFAFLYFFTGCMIVSIAGFILVKLNIIGQKRGKYVFHYLLSKYNKSVLYVMINLTKILTIDPKVSFDRPAVYIANHSSFLDILLMTMLHPKLVLLTNKWVYRSPVFGAVVRMAEYYPVADGAEESIEPLRDLVARGYGIVVFPEGTRSKTDKISRFHKGAFYVSEQLQLDIVPIILHGVHYTMQKGDFLLKDGTIRLQMLAPIAYADRSWGDTVKDRTKSISLYFKTAFADLKTQKETPGYFREQLIRSNTYKGPVLEWYCRIKTALEGNYELFHPLLPRKGIFYDLGCGYGFMTYMLHWASEDRTFIGVDYDEEKIETAQHNYKNNPDKIRFEHADINQYTLNPCDGIIISDVLHYLLPEQQTALLNRCKEALGTNGILIIRDGVKDLAERHKGTELSEKYSTRIVNFNKTQNDLHFISKSFITQWAATNGFTIDIIDKTKKTSNLIFILKKQEGVI